MPIPSRIYDISATASNNSPAGSDAISTTLDDYLRSIQAIMRGDLATKGSDIASSSVPDVGAVQGWFHDMTGTTTVTGFATVAAGVSKVIKFEAATQLTHSTAFALPGSANITTADGDVGIFISEGAGNWRCLNFQKVSGAPVKMSPITASLGADVNLNNTGSYFDGPSIAQGTAGTWFVSGTCTIIDTAGAANFHAKLWDGTTVIASCHPRADSNQAVVFSLSGYISSPAGNLRISVKDTSSISGLIKYNVTGNAKDSTITAIRIA